MSKFHEMEANAPPPPGYNVQQIYPQMQPVVNQPGPGMATHHTTVVVQQPLTTVKQQRAWSSGVCGCFEDIASCIMVWFCQPCYECHLSTRMGESCCVPVCVPGGMIALRTKLRSDHGIQGSVCDDCITQACCGPCATCQLARELNYVERNPTM